MTISYRKFYNEDKRRTEYIFVNYEYFDGNELLARIFQKKFSFKMCYTFDGIWYKILRICLDECVYELQWHEDVGNTIFSLEQSVKENELLEERLNVVIAEVNNRMQ